MRVFQAVGIGDELQHKIRVNPGMRFVDDKGAILLDWPRPTGIGRQAWHTSYRLHQPDLESLLRAAMALYDNCALKLGCELLHYDQLEGAIELTYKDKTTDTVNTCRSKFIIGCDGAKSGVRAVMQTDMDDLGFRQRWLVVDILLKHDMPELGDHTVQYCSSAQPVTYCRNPGLRRRWEMALPDTCTDEQALDSSAIWSSLSSWVTPQVATLERKAVYTFGSQVAMRWRDRRAFIAGDAAHLTPPFMGQGMCAGIRDAANLAWKLAMVLNNECEDELLDSYEHERSPHVREYITTAIALGKLIQSVEPNSVRSIASESDTSALKMASIAPKLGPTNLTAEPIRLGAHVGVLFDQFSLADGTRLDDLLGYRHVLISRCGSASVEVKPAGQENIVLSADDQTALSALLQQWKIEAVFVRPDRYILATSSDATDCVWLNWQSLLLSAKQ